MKVFKLLLASLALGLASFAAQSHHSTAGVYNEDKEVELVGAVKRWRFINPHPLLTIEVAGPKGPEEWEVSYGGSAVIHMQRRGFTAQTFKPGDRVRVRGYATKVESAHGLLARGNPLHEDGSEILPADKANNRPF